MSQSTIESKNKNSQNKGKDPAKETILTPRFYTTDFDAMAKMDLSINEEELEAICEEFRKDYNRHHFVRNSEFEGAADKLDPETRKVFIESIAAKNAEIAIDVLLGEEKHTKDLKGRLHADFENLSFVDRDLAEKIAIKYNKSAYLRKREIITECKNPPTPIQDRINLLDKCCKYDLWEDGRKLLQLIEVTKNLMNKQQRQSYNRNLIDILSNDGDEESLLEHMLFPEDVGFGNQVYNKLKKNKSDTSLFQKCEEYLENDERYDSLLWILTKPNKNHFPFMFFRLHLKISRIVRFGQDVEILLEEMWQQVLKLDNGFCKQAQTIAWYKHKILEHFNQEIEKPHFYLRASICNHKYSLIKCNRSISQKLEGKVCEQLAEVLFTSFELKQNNFLSKVTNLLTGVDISRIVFMTLTLFRIDGNFVDRNNYAKFFPQGTFSINPLIFTGLDITQRNMEKEEVKHWKKYLRELKKRIRNKSHLEIEPPNYPVHKEENYSKRIFGYYMTKYHSEQDLDKIDNAEGEIEDEVANIEQEIEDDIGKIDTESSEHSQEESDSKNSVDLNTSDLTEEPETIEIFDMDDLLDDGEEEIELDNLEQGYCQQILNSIGLLQDPRQFTIDFMETHIRSKSEAEIAEAIHQIFTDSRDPDIDIVVSVGIMLGVFDFAVELSKGSNTTYVGNLEKEYIRQSSRQSLGEFSKNSRAKNWWQRLLSL